MLTRAVLFCGGLTFLGSACVVRAATPIGLAAPPVATALAAAGLVFCVLAWLVRRS